MNLEENVREDGIIDDTIVETHYRQLNKIIMADDYLRVQADDGIVDIETRIPLELLEQLGFKHVPSGVSEVEYIDGDPNVLRGTILFDFPVL